MEAELTTVGYLIRRLSTDVSTLYDDQKLLKKDTFKISKDLNVLKKDLQMLLVAFDKLEKTRLILSRRTTK